MKADLKDVPKFSWWDLMKAFYFLLDTKRSKYFTYTTILILVLFYDLVPTLIIGMIVDFFTNYSVGASLKDFYILVVVLSITYGIVSFIRLTVKKKLSTLRSDVTYFTRVRGFERLLDFSVAWHDKENTGNKVQRIQNGTDALRQLQVLFSNELIGQITGIVGVLIAFLFIKPLFFVYALGYIAIFMGIQLSFYQKMVEMNNANNTLQEKAGGTYYEGLNNMLTIKTLGVKDDFKKNVMSREGQSRDYSIKKITLNSNKWKFFQVINALSIGGMLLLIGQGFVSGAISLGSIFVLYNYFQRMSGNVFSSTDSVENLVSAKVSIARMMPIFWDDVSAKQGSAEFPKTWDRVEIKNATFTYPKKEGSTEGGEEVRENAVKDSGIKDMTVTINIFEKVGVVGKSGSGKSTFAKVLLGLYEFSEGEFKIGGVNYRDIKHDEITKHIALVLQDSEMFNLSLKENITLMRQFDAELFEKALVVSQLKEVIEKLPQGVDTLIGEKGYRLSGGERQRIGIARAIYKDPQVLVLDEATSALDSKTEALIQQEFETHLKKKTVISIAHRISTLKNVDKVIVFDGGQVVEEGKFNDLVENPGSKFYEIYKHQGTQV
jgi:ABC-type multidrug transport system fused ATPase/permease subunit